MFTSVCVCESTHSLSSKGGDDCVEMKRKTYESDVCIAVRGERVEHPSNVSAQVGDEGRYWPSSQPVSCLLDIMHQISPRSSSLYGAPCVMPYIHNAHAHHPAGGFHDPFRWCHLAKSYSPSSPSCVHEDPCRHTNFQVCVCVWMFKGCKEALRWAPRRAVKGALLSRRIWRFSLYTISGLLQSLPKSQTRLLQYFVFLWRQYREPTFPMYYSTKTVSRVVN